MAQNGRPVGQMAIKLGLDSTAFSDSLTGASRASKTAVKEMTAGFKIAEAGGNKLLALKTKQEGLTKVIQAQSNELGHLKTAYDKTLNAQGEATSTTAKAAQKYNDAQAKLASYQAQLSKSAAELAKYKVQTEGFTGGLYKASESLTKFGEKATSVGSSVQKLGGTLTKSVTAPLVLGMAGVAKAAISWESSFAGVKKTSDEVVDSNGKVVYSYDDLEKSLRSLTKELPATHSEIAAVAEQAGQLGIATQDVTSFTKTMIDMGESTNLSAEDAATAIAKIANITGMTSSEYERFGSSVVALGNNFATTESDIVQMSNRLAAAGTLAGLSNQEILGLATAMSSVGIEAEAGGTAMTQTLTAIESAAAKGGEDLNQFAKIAGVSSDKFVSMWKDKPVDALQSFIKGLGELDKKGESATLVLDDMGLSGVRQSNMLKSLALASDTMSEAVDMSNTAWEENTALAKEAGTRYETTGSKLDMLKNEAVEAAIEFGGPLVDAIRDGLEASEPLIKGLGNMAKAFSSLDKEQQQNIIKWGLYAAAAGPALKLLGTGISTIGSVSKGLGILGKSIVGVASKAAEKKAIEGLTVSVTDLGGKAAVAGGAKGIGKFGSALGMINPWVAGATLAIGGGLAIWELWGKGAVASANRTSRWGTDVGKAADESLTKFEALGKEGTNAIENLANGVEGSAERISNAFKDMTEEMHNSVNETYNKNLELIKSMPEELQASMMKDLENKKKIDEQTIASAEEVNNKVMQIISSKNAKEGKLSSDQKELLLEHQRTLNAKEVELMDVSAGEKKEILAALNGDIQEMNDKQLKQASISVLDSLTKQKEAHRQQNKDLKEVYKDDVETYNLKSAELKALQDSETENMVNNYIKVMKKRGESEDAIRAELRMNGYSTEQAAKFVENYSDRVAKSNSIIAKSNGEVSESTRKANDSWNTLIFDPKTGEIKTNLPEFLSETAQSNEGWNQLSFIAKEANLDSNAKEKIFESMSSAGEWNQLGIPEKMLKADNLQLILGLSESKESLKEFNGISPELKKLLVDGSDKMKIDESRNALDQYNNLSPQLKALLTNNSDTMTKVNDAKSNLNIYDGMKPGAKILKADNRDTVNNTNTAKGTLESYNRLQIPTKQINTSADTSGATEAENAINRVPESKTSTITTKHVSIWEKIKGAMQWAKGTDNHPGGLALVNDQRGPLYKEYVELPNGSGFIPQGRNVMLDLPRGSKVLKASDTKKVFPKYSDGIGIPSNTKMVGNLKAMNQESVTRTVVKNDFVGLEKLLKQMLNVVSRLQPEINIYPEWNDVTDIKKTSEQLAWLTSISERGDL